MKIKKLLVVLLLISGLANAAPYYSLYPDLPWGVMFYYGKLQETSLLNAFYLNAKTGPAIYSFEVSHELAKDNAIRHFMQPILTTMAIAGNVSYINDPAGPVYEFDPYLQFRWANFPWERFIANTIAAGWGVSYDSRVTTWEHRDSNNTKRFLNYLMFETTFALPQYPQWQLVVRLHHRSGAFGLYGADNTGSNFLGVGLRYNF